MRKHTLALGLMAALGFSTTALADCSLLSYYSFYIRVGALRRVISYFLFIRKS